LREHRESMEAKYSQFLLDYEEYSEKVLTIETEYNRVVDLNEK